MNFKVLVFVCPLSVSHKLTSNAVQTNMTGLNFQQQTTAIPLFVERDQVNSECKDIDLQEGSFALKGDLLPLEGDLLT